MILKNSFLDIFFKISLVFFLFSTCLYAQETDSTKQKQQPNIESQTNQDNMPEEIDPYNLGFIIHLIQNKKIKSTTDEHIEELDQQMQKIIDNINQEVVYNFDQVEHEKQMRFLNSKININSRYDNNLAIARDTIKIIILENKKNFAKIINSIIDGKNSFKDKRYFISLLEKEIEALSNLDLKKYKNIALKLGSSKDSISIEFKKSLETLQGQIKADIFVLTYLKSNINKYRASNFILDDLSLKYIIEKIDSYDYIKNVSEITDYYFHVSLGKIVILLFIFLLFYIVNKKILPSLIKQVAKKIAKKTTIKNSFLLDILPSSFLISLTLYIFSFQLSLFLLIENPNRLNQLLAWFDTLYLAIFAYMFYGILNNYINLSSDRLFKNYPNMRKEMVDFILRILKVIILIILLLFLLVRLNFDIKAIIASLGIGGIAVALAAKDTLSNFFGSLNIITDNSFSQGDWIQAGDVEGTVVDIRMRTTRIRTFANAMITVPNAQLANMSILNWSKRVIGRRIKMSLGITYGSKMSDIENLALDIRDMLQNHDSIASSKLTIDKKPYLLKKEDLIGIKNTTLVYIDEYSASSINILVYCFSRSPNWEDWLKTKQDVIVKISQLVEKNNCSFAFPTQTIHLEQDDSLVNYKRK